MRPDEDAEITAADLLPVEPDRVQPLLGEIETLASQVGDALRFRRPAATGKEDGEAMSTIGRITS
jgi:hypothetical protein